MSRRSLLFLDLILAVVAGALAFRLYQTWTTPLSLPSAKPAPPASRPAEVAPEAPPVRPAFETYAVVASRNLFSPDRSEAPPTPPAQAKATAPAAPRPYLHGVVVRLEGALAYLEDPRTRKVYAYKVGDLVADGRLVEILEDRVVITRAGERLEVLLRDPAKPKAAPTAAPPAARRPPPVARPTPSPRVLPRVPEPPTAEEPETPSAPEGRPEGPEPEGGQ